MSLSQILLKKYKIKTWYQNTVTVYTVDTEIKKKKQVIINYVKECDDGMPYL